MHRPSSSNRDSYSNGQGPNNNRSSNGNSSGGSTGGFDGGNRGNSNGYNRQNNNYGGGGGGSGSGGSGGGGSYMNNKNGNNYGQPSFQRKINPNQHEEIHLKKPLWNSSTMKPFEKEFYRESSLVNNRLQEDLNEFLNTNSVTVSGNRFIKPILNFNELDIPDGILNKIRDAKYDKPTPIQSMCWPTLLSGLDMVGIAQTGSGKTLGFVLPMLMHISKNHRYVRSVQSNREEQPGPIALVLAPTRELAIQIQQVAEEFGQLTGVRNVVIYGGASKMPQLQQIKRGAEIYIATPGRLLDFLKEESVSLTKCTFLVLDEADRMLDMGFEPQIRKIIEQIRPDRQTLMFSATWPKEVRKLAEDFISNYVHITIGASEFLTANPNIKQIVQVCADHEKEPRLKRILEEIMIYRDSKAIIFAETKKRVDEFSRFIRNLGYHCLTIHGDKKQMERERVLSEFKKKPKSILCATDVAARGINVSDIKYVINIDYPVQTEDYIHRIGRTARSTNSGTAFTFITSDNARHLPKLMEVLRECNQFISEDLINLARSTRGGGGGQFNRNMQQRNNYGANNHMANKFNSSSSQSMQQQPQKLLGNNTSYNNHPDSDYGNRYESSGSRKRDHDEINDSSYGNGNDMSKSKNGADTNRVKKFRWDQGPPPGNIGHSNDNKNYSNGSNGSNKSSSNNNSNVYTVALPPLPSGPPPPLIPQSAPPPPPPPTSLPAGAQSQSSASPMTPHMPAMYGADYNSVYNLQYYQAIAAAAANNGSSWQAAQQTAYQGWPAVSK